MADTIVTVPYFSVTVPNKVGEGAKLFASLKDAGVSLIALWGYPVKGKKTQLDLVPVDPKLFTKTAKKLGLETEKKSAICWAGEDRLGAVADATAKLGAAGINILAAQAICSGEGRFGALIQVDADDVKKAAKLLAK
jgi:predicted amino acid-binding ACT domain protein